MDQSESLPKILSIDINKNSHIHWDDENASGVEIEFNHSVSDPFSQDCFQINSKVSIDPAELELLKLYLPYTLTGYFGRKYGKCFTISHFAQTLDGKIATVTGDSRWIGNEENLIHAHRMRALCDAILVGSKTLTNDNPRLNVRRVEGKNPTKVVIGGNGQLKSERFHAIEATTLVFKDSEDRTESYDCILCEKSPDSYDLKEVLSCLVERGIYSVYIEGGSYTTSSFLKQSALDQVQIHLSTKILGAGVGSFVFEGIDTIKNAVTFHDSRFVPIGDEMMFVGNLKR